MDITIHITRPGSDIPEAVVIAEEILVADLLRQILDDHEQFDLFQDRHSEPQQRHQSAREVGIKHGDHLHCKPREVRVHMDEEQRLSPRKATGSTLYDIWKVAPGHQLFREIKGNCDDEPIFRDEEPFELEQDEHFHSSDKLFSGYHITVNTEPKTVCKRLLSYDDVVELSGEKPPTGTDPEMTVQFEDADRRHPDGTLFSGDFVKVKNGTIFHVSPTNRS